MSVQDLSIDEIEGVNGGIYSARMVLWGTLAGIAGAGLAVAGLGTPISIGGVALAAEGASAVAIGLTG